MKTENKHISSLISQLITITVSILQYSVFSYKLRHIVGFGLGEWQSFGQRWPRRFVLTLVSISKLFCTTTCRRILRIFLRDTLTTLTPHHSTQSTPLAHMTSEKLLHSFYFILVANKYIMWCFVFAVFYYTVAFSHVSPGKFIWN